MHFSTEHAIGIIRDTLHGRDDGMQPCIHWDGRLATGIERIDA